MDKPPYDLINPASGTKSQLPIRSGTIGPDFLDIANLYRDHGVFTFDPGFSATASCESKITYIDGDAGVLLYRGYPVEQLAERSSFMEVAYLLIHGELPNAAQLSSLPTSITRHTMINESLLRFFNGFHHDAHPMAMVSAVVASMSAFYHDSMDIHDPRHREIFSHRIVAKLPTIAAAAHKHALGQPFIYPRNDLDYCANLLNMFFAVPCEPYDVDPVAAQALDLLFILHADHEQNASTSTVRLAGSTGANPYAAISAGVSALWGPAHGGANEAVLNMLEQIGNAEPHPQVPGDGQGQEQPLPAHGLRAPGLQELRSARQDHPRGLPPRARQARQLKSAVRAGVAAGGDRAEGRILRLAQALSERGFLLRASSTARSAFRARCSRSCSRLPAPWAGSRTGWR